MSAQAFIHRPMKKTIAWSLLSLLLWSQIPAKGQASFDTPVRGLGDTGMRRTNTIKLNDLEDPAPRSFGAPTAQGTFPVVTLNLAVPPPLSLSGVKVAGLSDKNVASLAYHHMIMMQGTSSKGTAHSTMYGVYQANKAQGRANFVTADSLMHGYFTYINTLTVKVVDESLHKELMSFLKSLKESTSKDYKACEIAEVKDDLLRNLGFIIVAIQLLNPAEVLPDMGGASDLAAQEMALIKKGGQARSPIFNRSIDYSALRPLGYFSLTAKSRTFYTAYSWLSRCYLSLTDLTNNTEQGGGNTFRRAVLLYRAIYNGKTIDGQPLLSQWRHISEVVTALSQGQLSREPSIYVDEMNSMFNGNNLEFKDLLTALAQPLSRAKLLISIKKTKPQGLDATSIFDMQRTQKSDDGAIVFRLFAPFSTVEVDYLRALTNCFVEESEDKPQTPLALFLLFAMGSPMASNVLNGMGDNIEPRVFAVVPEFIKILSRRHIEDSIINPRQTEKRWSLLSEYFKPLKKGSQACLISQYWLTQRLLSAAGAFVDSYVAYDPSALGLPAVPVSAPKSGPSGDSGGDNASDPKAAPPPEDSAASSTVSKVKAVNFQYLEPALVLYQKLAAYTGNTVQELTRLSVMPESLKSKGIDLVRLMERMAKISEKELATEPLPLADFRLLAGIDQILPAIGGPICSQLYLSPVTTGGATIGVGDATLAYVLFNTDQGPYLARGSLYSYFEVAGGPYKAEQWQRKKDFGFLTPPGWVHALDVMQLDRAGTQADESGAPGTAPRVGAQKSGSAPQSVPARAPQVEQSGRNVTPALKPQGKFTAPLH